MTSKNFNTVAAEMDLIAQEREDVAAEGVEDLRAIEGDLILRGQLHEGSTLYFHQWVWDWEYDLPDGPMD